MLHGELPTEEQLKDWTWNITHHTFINENIKKVMDGFHYNAHPMGMFVATLGALATFYPDAKDIFDTEARWKQIYRLIAKVPTIAAFAYRHNVGMPYAYPDNDLSYEGNFLNMMFKTTESKLQAESGPRTSAQRALHSARRSRTELQHQRDAQHRQRAHRSVFRHWPVRRRRSMARCTAAPTRWCCGCSRRLDRSTTCRNTSSA